MPGLLFLFVAAFAAFTVSTVAGGGAGLLLIPVLGFVVPAAQVPAALSIGTSASALARVTAFRSEIRWRAVGWFVPAALPSAALGAWLLTRVSPLYIELAVGLFLVGHLVTLARKRVPVQPRQRSGLAWLAVGIPSGFLSGFVGAIGLTLNEFYLRSDFRKEEIVATRAANEVLLHLAKLGLYVAFGLLTREAVVAGVVIAVAALLAVVAGRRILARLEDGPFRCVGRLATVAAGLALCVSAGAAVAAQNGVRIHGVVRLSGIKAKLEWSDGAASVHWIKGRQAEFERTIDMAALPIHVRALVERHRFGAQSIVCERVLRFGQSGYEIKIIKDGTRIVLIA